MDQIQLLKEIQSVDLEIAKILGREEELLKEIEGLEKDFEDVKKTLTALKGLLDDLKEKQRKVSREVEEGKGRIERDKKRLKEVRSEKEYRALLKEIEGTERKVREGEEEILKVMEEMEGVESQIHEKEKALSDLEGKIMEKRKAYEEEKKGWDRLLEEKKKAREEIARSIRPDVLREYEFIRNRRKGVAVVPIRDGTCSGCNMSVPPQIVLQVRKKEEIVYCPYCRIILSWGESET